MKKFVEFVRSMYSTPENFIPLHEPRFVGNEKEYLNECIDSTFVSSVGKFVDKFEQMVSEYTGSKYAIAAVNGTAALHIALQLSGVKETDEVITQPLTFIATANAITYANASPIFIDVDRNNMGLSATKLKQFLANNTVQKGGFCYNKNSGKRIKACVPMHTFGHVGDIVKIKETCQRYNIDLIEDSAESLGSFYNGKHSGTYGKFGILSFNGNKTITTGGGGMILTDDEELAKLAKHITTTAKIPHKWDYAHDYVGYNYRLTNLAAALGCAQMEKLPEFIENKRNTAGLYAEFFKNSGIKFVKQPGSSVSNYWLNAVILNNRQERDNFLEYTNNNGIMTRPIWKLMNKLSMFQNCECGDLSNSEWLEDRVVNIPSSVII